MNLCWLSVTTLLFSFNIFWKLIDGSYIGDVAINCGYHGVTTALDGRRWFGDMDSTSDKSILQPRGYSRTFIPHQKSLSADPIPYMTARTSATQFYYSFPVNPGQKFIRLHFYSSSSYRGFEKSRDVFTVKAGPFTLLRNFSASLAADAMGVNYIIKEFSVNVEDNQFLNLSFTPTQSAKGKNYHAYINGIEIITMPTGLYFTPDGDLGARIVGQSNGYFRIDNSTALETVQRLNIGGSSISPVEDFGMFRRWNEDSNYLMGSELQPVNHLVPGTNTGVYTFSAPPRICHTSWQTAKNKRTDNAYYNFTWKIPVDLGFGYLMRLHFCDFALVESAGEGMEFNVLIDNQVAETEADVIRLSARNRVPIYRDYLVMVKGDEVDKYDLFIALQSSDELAIELLRGLEIFKLSNLENNLASKNEVDLKQVSAASWNPKTKHFLSPFDRKNTFVTGITILLILLNLIASKLRQNWEESTRHEEEDSQSASRKQSCRKFSLDEIILATQNFSNAFLIGKGGFGYVYKGFIRAGSETVAIKRLKSNSKQGAREFWMEIETLSSIRHKHLVSLIGYCKEYQEMILVYEYMPCGTLADNLYEIGRNGEDVTCLTWEQRLSICIGAACGLDYLHTGIEYEIIHRDVKDSNILLDKNFVAKISDFGLSKLRNVSESQGNLSTKVKGTPGFVDPDYFMTHKPTTKTDVYAFGVVMLVVLCGRPAIDRSIPWEPRSLLSLFQEHMRKGDVNGIVDPSMQGKISTQSLNEFVKSLENCLHIEPRERPTMSQVATSLEWAMEMQQSTMSCNPEEAPAATSASGLSCDDEYAQSFRLPPIQEEGFTTSPVERITGKVIDGDWEIDHPELDFSNSAIIGKGSFRVILKADWRGTPVAVKRIPSNLSDDRLAIQDFRHEVNLLVKLRHPNIVQFLGAVTEKKPLMLITEYLRGGDLHQYLKEKGALSPLTAINFALDIARGMAYLHNEPNVVIHRDLKPRNVLLVNSSADHLKVGDFGLSKLIRVRNCHEVYKMTRETGSYRYMAPEVFKHQKCDKKVDVFSFAMILYEMLEGEPPFSCYEPYKAAKYVAEGHRPMFRAKGFLPELRELVEMCWAAEVNQRPSFLQILKRLEKIRDNFPSDHHWNIFTTKHQRTSKKMLS